MKDMSYGWKGNIIRAMIVIVGISYNEKWNSLKYKIGEKYFAELEGPWFEGPGGIYFNRVPETNDYILKKDCILLSEWREKQINEILK